MFLQARYVLNARQMKRWVNERRQRCVLIGDTSFDLLQLCFEFQTILGSHSQFFAKGIFSLLIHFFELIYFIHDPEGNFSFHNVFAVQHSWS